PPGCPPSKRNHLSVTGSEQIRDTDPRCEVALSAEHQLRADPQTKHRPAATCTNASACISARSRGVFEPLAFPLPTSLSRLYAHLRASAWWRRVSPTRAWGRTGQNRAFVVTAWVAPRRAKRRLIGVIHPNKANGLDLVPRKTGAKG